MFVSSVQWFRHQETQLCRFGYRGMRKVALSHADACALTKVFVTESSRFWLLSEREHTIAAANANHEHVHGGE